MKSGKIPNPPSAKTPDWFDDEQAKEEAKNWDNEGALKGQHQKNHLRLVWIIGYIFPALLILFTCIFSTMVFFWVWHFLTPGCEVIVVDGIESCKGGLHWLDADQLSKIQAIIFSGSIGAITSTFAQKYFKK